MISRFGRVLDDLARAAKGRGRNRGSSELGLGTMTLEGELRQKSSIGDRIAFGLCTVLTVGSIWFLGYALMSSGTQVRSSFTMPRGGLAAPDSPLRPARENEQSRNGAFARASGSNRSSDESAGRMEVTAKTSGYKIRKAFPGYAVIDGPDGQIQVLPEMEIPGVGRVLAIRQFGAEWVVETTGGLIVEAM